MIRVGFIGFGGVARSHAKDLAFFREDNPQRRADDPVVEIVAGCDPRPEALAGLREQTGAAGLYGEFDEMLEQEDLDLVHITTRADVRLGPVAAAARHGVHVLCEKPMAVDLATCEAMIEACDQAGVQLVVSHQRRTDPMHWYVRQLVEEGFIGDLRYIRGTGKPRRGGNEMHNIGSHLIDAIGVFGGEAAWVLGYCTTDGRPSTLQDAEPGDRGIGLVLGDRVDVRIGYQTGVQAQLAFNEDPSRLHWELIGSGGRIYFEQGKAWHYGEPVWTPHGGAWDPIELPDAEIVTGSGFVYGPDAGALIAEHGPVSRIFMLRELFARMKSGGEHTSSGRRGRDPIEIMQATFVSHLNAARVSLPLKERNSPLG